MHHLLLTPLKGYESRDLRELSYDAQKWDDGDLNIHDTVDGTALAAVKYTRGDVIQIRVYYQTHELMVKEFCYNINKGWYPGKFIHLVYAIHATYRIFPKRPIQGCKGAIWSYGRCYRQ
jgi:hypothetical protein